MTQASNFLKLVPIRICLLSMLVFACATASPQSSDYDASDDQFLALEPTTLGLIASPTIWEVLEPVAGQTPQSTEGNQSLKVYVRKSDNGYKADVIESGLLDDSLKARHVRLDLRKEPEGVVHHQRAGSLSMLPHRQRRLADGALPLMATGATWSSPVYGGGIIPRLPLHQ